MRKFILIALLTSWFNTTKATIIGGVITINTTITAAGNPYIVTSDLQIAAGVTYTVDPGVELYFQQDLQFIIAGTLIAVGNSGNKIIMTTDILATSWEGLVFYNNASDYDTLMGTGCQLKHCVISEMEGVQPAIDCYNTMIIENCEIFNYITGVQFNVGGYLYNSELHHDYYWAFNSNLGNGKIILKNNEFHDLQGNGNAVVTINDALIKNNYFHDNSCELLVRIADTCKITNNTFINNPNAIALYLLGGNNHLVKYNYFNQNRIHLKIDCQRTAEISENCFNTYGDHTVYVSQLYESPWIPYDCVTPVTTTLVDISDNTFFSAVPSQIDLSLHDVADDVANVFQFVYLPLSSTGCLSGVENDLFSLSGIAVYPNPAVNYIEIQSQLNIASAEIQITSLTGEFVYNKFFTNFLNERISLEGLADGLYLLRIKSNDKETIQKIVKQS